MLKMEKGNGIRLKYVISDTKEKAGSNPNCPVVVEMIEESQSTFELSKQLNRENGTSNGTLTENSASNGKFRNGIARVKSCVSQCLTSHNPLPENPSLRQRVCHAFRLPPHGHIAVYIRFAVICLQIWAALYCFSHREALPGGNLFSLFILFFSCAVGGCLISFVNLPPLLGMLILGLMLRNVPGIKYIGEHIDAKWSGTLRKVASTVILTRAGLGFDLAKLRNMWLTVVRLAVLPCTAEIVTVGVVSHFLVGFPWVWSMMLGCVLGALSTAVTVPSLVNLQDRKYGVTKGIPTMLLSVGGIDTVMCVTSISVLMGIIFSSGDNLALTIAKGPLGIVAGIAYGFVAGMFLWYIPSGDGPNRVFFRYVMLLSAGLIVLFGSSEIGLKGAGPIGCLTTATIAAYKWRQGREPGEKDAIAGVMALTWMIIQHFLFGLIGAAVNIANIKTETVGLGIATLAIGLVARSLVSITGTMGMGFNWKERLFVMLTWLAKATVQAAFGGLALDNVIESHDPDGSQLKYATDILTISVLAIIICAPLGATCIAVFGPKFLVQGDQGEVEEEEVKKETKIEKEALPAVEVVVDLASGKNSVRSSSHASLASTSFQSELSSVLRRQSKADIIGFDNPAFDSITKVRQQDNMEKLIDYVVDTKVELHDDVFEDNRKESTIDRKQRHVVIADVSNASKGNGIDLKRHYTIIAKNQFKTILRIGPSDRCNINCFESEQIKWN